MQQIADGVWQIPLLPRNAVNAYLVGDVIVDAGYLNHGKKVVSAVEGHEVRAHALTHVHNDHAGGSRHVHETLGVPVWIGAGDAEYLRTGTAPASPYPIVGTLARFSAAPALPVDRELHEGDDIGNGFTVLEVPGHSPGHVAFWREADRTLIAGDVFFNFDLMTTRYGLRQPPRFFNSDGAENRRSERRLAGLDPAVLAFGHGPPLRDPAELRRFVAALPAD